jgi:hypothetical protein
VKDKTGDLQFSDGQERVKILSSQNFTIAYTNVQNFMLISKPVREMQKNCQLKSYFTIEVWESGSFPTFITVKQKFLASNIFHL